MKTHPLAIYGVVLSAFLTYSGAGIGLGYLLWEKWNWPWWVILVTTLAGLSMACWHVIRYQRRMEQE